MLLSSRIKFALALWFALEALLFILVVKVVGLGGAILLGLLTSVIGLSTLRRAGASAMMKMRLAMGRRQESRGPGGMIEIQDETLATIGAAALLVPGFLSDIVGLVLITPALRGLVAARAMSIFAVRTGVRPGFKHGPKHEPKHGPSTIDLDPQDWRPIDGTTRTMPRV